MKKLFLLLPLLLILSSCDQPVEEVLPCEYYDPTSSLISEAGEEVSLDHTFSNCEVEFDFSAVNTDKLGTYFYSVTIIDEAFENQTYMLLVEIEDHAGPVIKFDTEFKTYYETSELVEFEHITITDFDDYYDLEIIDELVPTDEEDIFYYQITATDTHGNQSVESIEIEFEPGSIPELELFELSMDGVSFIQIRYEFNDPSDTYESIRVEWYEEGAMKEIFYSHRFETKSGYADPLVQLDGLADFNPDKEYEAKIVLTYNYHGKEEKMYVSKTITTPSLQKPTIYTTAYIEGTSVFILCNLDDPDGLFTEFEVSFTHQGVEVELPIKMGAEYEVQNIDPSETAIVWVEYYYTIESGEYAGTYRLSYYLMLND